MRTLRDELKKMNSPVRDDFLVFGSPAIEQPEIDEVVE